MTCVQVHESTNDLVGIPHNSVAASIIIIIIMHNKKINKKGIIKEKQIVFLVFKGAVCKVPTPSS